MTNPLTTLREENICEKTIGVLLNYTKYKINPTPEDLLNKPVLCSNVKPCQVHDKENWKPDPRTLDLVSEEVGKMRVVCKNCHPEPEDEQGAECYGYDESTNQTVENILSRIQELKDNK